MENIVKIVTRTYGAKLHEYCKAFIDLPYEIIPVKGVGNDQYIKKILSLDVDFIINIDEDCFVYDNYEILNLLQYMIDNNYDYCGVPDGGVLFPRKGSPIVMNPFFNIFDLRKIRPKLLEAKIGEKIANHKGRRALKNKKIANYKEEKLLEQINVPLKTPIFKPATKENYYPIFYWLARNFKPLYLNGFTHSDKRTSVLLSHRNKRLCYHTWLARHYKENKTYDGINQRVRIDNLVRELAQELNVKID